MNNKKIVFIDDDNSLRFTMKRILGKSDSTSVYEFSDVESALEKVEEIQPNFIFLDNQLDGIWGSDAAFIFKEMLPQSKLILISSTNKISLIDKCFRMGADHFIEKNKNFYERVLFYVNQSKSGFNYAS